MNDRLSDYTARVDLTVAQIRALMASIESRVDEMYAASYIDSDDEPLCQAYRELENAAVAVIEPGREY